MRATSHETLARLHINPTDSVLDVGCGTGALLDQLSASCPQARLAGIDPSPEMLAIARERLSPGIELKQSWAEDIPYPDNAFDVVVSCNVFHYIRKPLVALQDMLRVLRPGGILVITDWCDDYLACRICDWHLRLFNAAHFQTYTAQQLTDLLNTAGTTAVHIDCYKISWLWGLMTATARKREPKTEPAIECCRTRSFGDECRHQKSSRHRHGRSMRCRCEDIAAHFTKSTAHCASTASWWLSVPTGNIAVCGS